ncbi:eukaryotic polypeptide chain release factor 3 [Mucor ambiguus]|uniref:Eukaryotic peptide chain release factor GTP-binding subunit n=1 Tax=Mucor ambiguus TaxID=91626 RepID=A0A0C9MCJ4_9FUNG|nr:eukaryotic polypeptide chain release factor 3 [Mucor ambiguus]
MSQDATNSFSKMNLNPSASEWKPNFGAKAFVPSFGAPAAAAAAPAPAPVAPAAPAPAPAAPKVVKLPESKPAAPAAPKPAAEAPKPKPAAPKPKAAPAAAPKKAPEPVQDEVEDVDDEVVADLYGKEHLNVVFMGHVDAGKSTMGGNILYLTGMVDKRTLEKYEREAKEAGRESWYLSWALDTNTEERAKGKTVETGRAYFETDKRRYTILDAPGHKNFVPSMIQGASQADIGVLVISARKGEFETGYERGGQTREHTMLAKTSGINKMVVAINKMDDPTVNWDKARYDEIVGKLTPFMKQTGFNPKTDIHFMPLSGFSGANIKDRDTKVCPWYDGPSLLEFLDDYKTTDRKVNAPLMIPISEKYKDMGTIVVGKIEAGHLKKGQQVVIMPNKQNTEVTAIYDETENEIEQAMCGDNIRMRLKGIEEDEIMPGFVLCSKKNPVKTTTQFEAQLAILDHKNIICAGYTAVLHIHAAAEEVQISALLHLIDKKTGKKTRKPPQFVKQGQKAIARIETSGPICIETFEKLPQLGRFTLRDEGKTVAIGKVTKVLNPSE